MCEREPPGVLVSACRRQMELATLKRIPDWLRWVRHLLPSDMWPLHVGYGSRDMPVKAKRSTYNYSLPITVKKTCKWLNRLHQDTREVGIWTPGWEGLLAVPHRQMQKVSG